MKIWIDGPVLDSYPMQGKLAKLEIVSPTKHEGAYLDESEAIQKGLEQLDTPEVVAINAVHFDLNKETWTITFQKLPSKDVHDIEVKDAK